MSFIELREIKFSYKGNKNGNFTLGKLNLSIQKGEIVSVFGPNGSGKSTLLKIISGGILPDEGNVFLNGKDIREYSHKNLAKIIGFVPTLSSSVYPFSVYEVVMSGRTPYLGFTGFEKKEDHEIVVESLKTVGIYHLRNKGINEVSGGEAQRAYIARALAQKTDVILLDEPTAHLDLKHQVAVFNLLQQLNTEKGITIVIVSHDLNLAGNFSNRAVLMKEGKIIKDGDVLNVLTENNISAVFEVESKVSLDNQDNKSNLNIHIKCY